MSFTNEKRAFYQENGYVVVENILSPDVLKRVGESPHAKFETMIQVR